MSLLSLIESVDTAVLASFQKTYFWNWASRSSKQSLVPASLRKTSTATSDFKFRCLPSHRLLTSLTSPFFFLLILPNLLLMLMWPNSISFSVEACLFRCVYRVQNLVVPVISEILYIQFRFFFCLERFLWIVPLFHACLSGRFWCVVSFFTVSWMEVLF